MITSVSLSGSQEAPWPLGDSETAALMRALDWSQTPLGPPSRWQQSLRTSVELALACKFPMVVIWGRDLVQLYNDGYRDLMGVKHPAGLGQPTRTCWPEVWHINEPIYHRVLEGEAVTFEDQLYPITRHGYLEDAYFTLCYSPLRGDAGAVEGILVTVFETTERIKTAAKLGANEARLLELFRQAPAFVEALRGPEHVFEMTNPPSQRLMASREAAEARAASEAELRWTVDLNPHMPWTADPEGRILDFKPRWLELTGMTREQALGDGWMQAPHPEDLSLMQSRWSHALESGEPYDVEHRLHLATGEIRWMRSRALPRRDDEGRIVRWYGSTEDIHDRKMAQEALLQSEKLAAVGRLASSIAHEINNPLEAVTNLLYLARTCKDVDEEVLGYIATAESELARVALITNQTLRFHKQSTRQQAVTCSDLIGSALAIYKGRLSSTGIKVEKRKRATRPLVCFDGEIRQVLNNLIGNAIEACAPLGGRLLIRSREGTDWKSGRKGLVLTVADNGIGMSAQTRKKIFDPFFSTKGPAGIGLGLWVSCEIVNRHRGELRVRSTQRSGRCGTVFTVFLPFDPQPAAISPLHAAA